VCCKGTALPCKESGWNVVAGMEGWWGMLLSCGVHHRGGEQLQAVPCDASAQPPVPPAPAGLPSAGVICTPSAYHVALVVWFCCPFDDAASDQWSLEKRHTSLR
jgi:hypothetical protein